jgi:hypothetical protein
LSSVFDEKSNPPDDDALADALGRSKVHWDALVAHLDGLGEALRPEWKFYGKKHGWQLKYTRKKKSVIYLIPHAGSFLAGMALPDAALARLRDAKLPAELVEQIENERSYREGRPARVEVRLKKHVATVKRLLVLTLA